MDSNIYVQSHLVLLRALNGGTGGVSLLRYLYSNSKSLTCTRAPHNACGR